MLRNQQKKPNKTLSRFCLIREVLFFHFFLECALILRGTRQIQLLAVERGVHSSKSDQSRTLLDSHQEASAALDLLKK
jgi:hypothetical protein